MLFYNKKTLPLFILVVLLLPANTILFRNIYKEHRAIAEFRKNIPEYEHSFWIDYNPVFLGNGFMLFQKEEKTHDDVIVTNAKHFLTFKNSPLLSELSYDNAETDKSSHMGITVVRGKTPFHLVKLDGYSYYDLNKDGFPDVKMSLSPLE